MCRIPPSNSLSRCRLHRGFDNHIPNAANGVVNAATATFIAAFLFFIFDVCLFCKQIILVF